MTFLDAIIFFHCCKAGEDTKIDYNELMDVNGDGEINVSDVTALIDKLINQN